MAELQKKVRKSVSLYEPKQIWKPVRINVEEKIQRHGEEPVERGYFKFETGVLSMEEMEAMLNTLPVDITFVDKDGA